MDRLAEFTRTPLYKNYYESLNLEREEILLVGKRTRDPHILSKLEGFDQAASYFQRCVDSQRADKEVTEELNNDD